MMCLGSLLLMYLEMTDDRQSDLTSRPRSLSRSGVSSGLCLRLQEGSNPMRAFYFSISLDTKLRVLSCLISWIRWIIRLYASRCADVRARAGKRASSAARALFSACICSRALMVPSWNTCMSKFPERRSAELHCDGLADFENVGVWRTRCMSAEEDAS